MFKKENFKCKSRSQYLTYWLEQNIHSLQKKLYGKKNSYQTVGRQVTGLGREKKSQEIQEKEIKSKML